MSKKTDEKERGWTRMYNDIILNDCMDMDKVELRITLILLRETFGYWDTSEKRPAVTSVMISTRDMAERCKVETKSVRRAMVEIETRQLFTVEAHPAGTVWSLGDRLKGIMTPPTEGIMTPARGNNDPSSEVIMTPPKGNNDPASHLSKEIKEIKESSKEENPTPSQNIQTPIDLVISRFTELTAIIPPREESATHDLKWRDPVDAMLNLCANDVGKTITLMEWCLNFASGDNDMGKGYTVHTPKSLLTTFERAATGSGGKAATAQWVEDWDLCYKLACENRGKDVPDHLIEIVRPLWPQMKIAMNGRVNELRGEFRVIYFNHMEKAKR